MTRVLIVAPTPALRAGLQALLGTTEIRVVGSATTFADLVDDLREADVVVVSDESLLGDPTRLPPDGQLAILVLAANSAPAALLRRIPLRGWGIVSPDASPAELQAAVTAVAQGLIVFPPALAEPLLAGSARFAGTVSEPLDEPLTTREQEVLQLLGQGLANKQIARQLHISEHTVKFHVSAIYTKLGAASRTDAVSRGARRGLLTL